MKKHLPPHLNTQAFASPAGDLRSLILSLIKEDLRCSKLVLGLSSLGLDAGKYHTEISNLVFHLMGLDHNDDRLLQFYFDRIDKVQAVEDIEEQGLLHTMSEELYALLLDQKNKTPNEQP